MTSQYICRIAFDRRSSCIGVRVLLSPIFLIWTSTFVNYQFCSIYKPFICHNYQDHEVFIAPIWRPWERNRMYWKHVFRYQEINMCKKMIKRYLHSHDWVRQEAIYCYFIAWVIHYHSTYSTSGIFWKDFHVITCIKSVICNLKCIHIFVHIDYMLEWNILHVRLKI